MMRRFQVNSMRHALMMSATVLLCGGAFAQQGPAPDSSPLPKAKQVAPSGRPPSGGVQAQQSSSGNGGSSNVNTVNSTIQVSGAYQGSIPDPNIKQGPLTLNIADAIRRGLRFNLGAVSANASVRQLRGQRLAALSEMLPNIYKAETVEDVRRACVAAAAPAEPPKKKTRRKRE